jgi:ketosteroid isomerase-like protein
MRPILTALACVAALAVVAGCGETDQEQAREVAQDYVDARNAADFEAVCALYSDQFKQELGTDDCAAFVREQTAGAEGDESLSLVDVRVREDVATADLDVTHGEAGPSRIVIRLERQDDGDWAITSLQ